MRKIKCWGITRELSHSPNRESDDYRIIQLVAEKLQSATGCLVELLTVPEVESHPIAMPDMAFLMCEEVSILRFLEPWQLQGVLMINTPHSIRNTFRSYTLNLLKSFNFYPQSVLVSTDDQELNLDMFHSVWIKRGDYHATQKSDVVLARSSDEIKLVLAEFKMRGIAQALIQKHVEGDLIKFYGVGKNWFKWFYHKDQNLKNYKFDEKDLLTKVYHATQTLGLEIWGGDAIVTEDGEIYLIDLNAWPSFALFREEAAIQIVDYLIGKIDFIEQAKELNFHSLELAHI